MTAAALSCFALAACDTAEGLKADSNLACAALISAATVLISRGKAENDPALMKRALVSSMTHLNTYAVPKNMREADAFAELNAQRQTFMETLTADQIIHRAKRCVDRTPAA